MHPTFFTHCNRSHRSAPLAIAALMLLAIVLAACSGQSQQAKAPPPPPVPVSVAPVVLKAMPLLIDTIGTVEAYTSVAIKTQVSGPLLSIHFAEGQMVQKGQLLYRIDPAPFEADVQQAEASLLRSRANLLRDKAQTWNAEQDVQRYTELVEKEYVTRQQFDAVKANAESLEATIKADEAAIQADEAALKNFRLNLSYCTILSPVTGRTGELLVHAGNLVKVNETILVNIFQIQPIYVNFTVPEQQLSAIRTRMAQQQLKAKATVPDAGTTPEEGVLTFMDNTVASGTGTAHLKATFENKSNTLWPGQFVTVSLILGEEEKALVVPTQAIQQSQEGQFVFVVRPDQTAESRQVTVDRSNRGESVVTSGLQAGEIVVTDGQMRLVDGARVTQRTTALEQPKHQ